MLGYFMFLRVRLHDPLLWFKAEKRAWHAGFDFGQTFARYMEQAVRQPTARVDLVASSAAGVVGILLLLWALRERLPIEQILYAAAVLILDLDSGFGGSIPRGRELRSPGNYTFARTPR